jgi:hypothetical protein
MDYFETLRQYRRLARQGFVDPLTHTCGEEYTTRLGEDEPLFQCFACGTKSTLGLAEYKMMQARIEDYEAKRAK